MIHTPEWFSSKRMKTISIIAIIIIVLGVILLQLTGSNPEKNYVYDIGKLHQSESGRQAAVQLTAEEKKYLSKKPVVTICVDPDWEPFEKINEKGEYVGIAADLLQLIAQRTGVQLQIHKTANWEESIDAVKAGRSDGLALLNQTPERDNWLLFTDPYFTDYNIFVTREEHPPIHDPATLQNETIVFPKGTGMSELIQLAYPNLKTIFVDSESKALEMVSEKKADMTMRSLIMAAYTIKKEGLFNLKIAGKLPNYTNKLRIGVNKNQPVLRDILNKGVSTITEQELQQVINKHVSIKVQTEYDYALLIKMAIGFAILLLVGGIWIFQLKHLNQKLAAREQELLQLSEQLNKDIAARKEIEIALRESEEQHRLLFETANEGIVVAQGAKLKYFNPVMVELTGYSAEELSTIDFIRIVAEEDRERIKNNYARRVKGEPVDKRYTFRVQRKDNDIRWIEMSGTRIEWQEQPATLNFLSDITEKKLAEIELNNLNDELSASKALLEENLFKTYVLVEELTQTKEKLEKMNSEKDKFFSIIAHDLRSPFSGFLGLTRAMSENAEDYSLEEYRTLGTAMHQSARNLFKLLKNLLEWAQMQQGVIPFNPVQVKLAALAENCITAQKERALQKNIRIQNNIGEQYSAQADENMIQSVLLNLISNAIKFTSRDGEITITASETAEGAITVSVADTGIGMKPELLAKIFKVGEKIGQLGTEGELSTGLGLLLCKEFVEKNRGRIWAESTVGEGSIFRFTLPVQPEKPLLNR